jgi:hypothetical protein
LYGLEFLKFEKLTVSTLNLTHALMQAPKLEVKSCQ